MIYLYLYLQIGVGVAAVSTLFLLVRIYRARANKFESLQNTVGTAEALLVTVTFVLVNYLLTVILWPRAVRKFLRKSL